MSIEPIDPVAGHDVLREVLFQMSPDQLKAYALTLKDPRDLALLERVMAEAAGQASATPSPLLYYHDRPAAFGRELINWEAAKSGGLVIYQAETLDNIVKHGRESVRGAHGLGKTTIAAIAVLWFALTREAAGENWKIPTTASKWGQLIHYLWPEVHLWANRLRWDAIGRDPFNRHELLKLNLNLAHGEAFSASPAEAAAIEGAHAEQLLYIFDEAKTIPKDIWDATEGAFSGAGVDTGSTAYALAISTPGEPNGRFYEIHKRQAGTEDWHARFVRKEEIIAAGRMSATWAANRKRQWGVTTATYQNRVEGEFASSDEDSVIPLSWIEDAQERWTLRYGAHGERWAAPGEPQAIGVDCSGSGTDRTVLARRYGSVIGPLERPLKSTAAETGEEEMATAGRIVGALGANPKCRAIVDAGGLGSGVVGAARQEFDRADDKRRVVAFIAGAKSTRKDSTGELGFVDMRAQAWWALREMLDPDSALYEELLLPPDDEMLGDLTAPHWREMSGGKIRVESKDEIRKRLGRSTDAGDAVVQAMVDPPPPPRSGTAAGARLPTMTG